MTKMTDGQIRKMAEDRVEFKIHAFIYVMVNLLLWSVWALTGQEFPWAIFPTLGWGIGLFIHFATTYRIFGLFSVENEISRIKDKQR